MKSLLRECSLRLSPRPYGRVWLAAIFCVGHCALFAGAGDAARPEWVVSSFDLGAVDQMQATNAVLADELKAQEWPAIPSKSAIREWDKVPDGVDPSRWVSFVTVGFGKRAEAYAFQFSGPRGDAKLLAHIFHRKRPIRGVEQWTSPFVNLINGFRVGQETAATTPESPLLQTEIIEALETADPDTSGKEASLDSALTLPPKKVMPPLRAIIMAAACSAGWTPTLQPAPNRVRIEVRVLDQACSFRFTFHLKDRELTIGPQRVPWEEYHDQLTLLFRRPTLSQNIVDLVRPNAGTIELLGVEANRIFYLADDEITALDTGTGLALWPVRVPQGKVSPIPKVIQSFTTRRDAADKLRLYRWTTALAEIAPADGKLIPLAPLAASTGSSFDIAPNGDLAIVQGSRVSLFSGGREVWNVSESHAITCGPRLDADRVLIGTDRGELIALARADHRVLWRTAIDPRPFGLIAGIGARRCIFSNQSETLSAIDPADGKIAWRFAAGDLLAQPPLLFENSVIVVTKGNRIVSLSPESGAVISEQRWPTWVVSLQPVKISGRPRLAVNDVSGKLTLLAENLKPVWEATLGTRLTGRTVLAPLPDKWKTSGRPAKGGTDELLDAIADPGAKPFLLTSDSAGFLFKISLEGIQ